MRTALDRVGATVGRWFSLCAGVAWLQGLLLGSAGFAFSQFAVNTLGTDRSVWNGLLLGTAAGALVAIRSRAPVTPAADRGWLALLLVLWPWWLSTCLELVAWLPGTIWKSSVTLEIIGCGLGFCAASLPASLLTRITRGELTGASVSRSAATVSGAAVGVMLMADLLGSRFGVALPPLCLTAISLLLIWRRASLNTTSDSVPAWRFTAWELPAACAIAASLGLAAVSYSQLTVELWPQTIQITALLSVAVLLGAAAACFTRGTAAEWFQRAPWAWACSLAGSVWFGPQLVELVLWQNATLISGWSLELGRAALLIACVSPLGFLGVVLFRGCSAEPARLLIGGTALLSMLAAPIVLTTAGPLAGLALAAGQALFAGAWLLSLQQCRPIRWAPWGVTTAALCAVVLVSGTSWNSGRAARLLFSTATVLAHRTGWEAPLLAQLDDTRLVTQPAGRNGRWTVWQSRGAEWQFRMNGVPRGAFTITPQWAPQVAPEAAAAFWPLVLVDQPARVLVLGAGTGAGLRTAAAFPVSEIVCHEADRTLIDVIRGPLAQACGYDPFAEHCRHVAHPAEWLATPEDERYDVIVSLPPTSLEQAGLASITAEYYARAAHRLSQEGVFAQRFSSVDYGPQPLLTVTEALARAFPETACVEVGMGEYLLLGAHRAEVLVRSDLPTRLERRGAHVAASLGWDWSFPLNLPAYDRDALHEAAVEVRATANTAASGRFGCAVPSEMMRWGPKLQETAALLAKPRATPNRFPAREESTIPQPLISTKTLRKSRYLDWIGPAAENGEVLRRLAEVAGRDKLIRDLPDAHWYAYRKELRQQLQEHPRTSVIPVNFTEESADRWHDEDRRRKAYFEELGELLDPNTLPEASTFQRLEGLLYPTDPLLTLFAHQELAEQYARAHLEPVREREHRLYAIYYSSGQDVSVRNVVVAIERLVEETDATCPPQSRFDLLNGLLQTLRVRWEGRNLRPTKSAKVTLQEIDRSLLAVERAIEVLNPLATTCAIQPADWTARKQVIERMLARPFRTYRDELTRRVRESELKTRQVLEQAEADKPFGQTP